MTRDRLRVVDAIDQRVRRESAEDDRVRRADAGAGQHGDGQLRRHAHVDRDAVALLDAERLQHVGELLHFAMQLLIGQDANFAGLALPDDRGFIFAPGRDVAVEAVVGEIDLAADEPFCPGTIPLENLVPLLEPVQFAGDPRPELFRLLDRLLVNALVFREALDVRCLLNSAADRTCAARSGWNRYWWIGYS